MFTIKPDPAATMCGATNHDATKWDRRPTSCIASHAQIGVSQNGPKIDSPAAVGSGVQNTLLTKMSMRPNSSITPATRSRT